MSGTVRSNGARRVAALLAVVAGLGVAPAASAPPAGDPNDGCAAPSCGQLVFFGTRGEGPGKGIAAARFDPATGTLTGLGVVAEVVNPTWLAASPHRSILYAVSETGNDGKSEASVLSYAVDKRSGALAPISRVGSGGGGATHLTIATRVMPPSILVANYGSGRVSAIPLGPKGVLSAPRSVLTETGSGPTPRQASAHPHGTATDPTGRFVFVADLGADRVFIDRFDPATSTLTAYDAVALPPGSGPRHVTVSPDGRSVYVNAEFTGDVLLLRWDAARRKLAFVKAIPTRAKGYAGEISSAEIAFSPDGRFLIVSNRGEDDLVVYAVQPATGDLREIQRLPSGGMMPASFAFDPTGRWLAVANAGSNHIATFRVDPSTGTLTATGAGLDVANPASVAWLQH